MADQAIATVVSVSGTAYARGPNGELRELQPGDVLREGETVVTPNGGSVELALEDGSPLTVVDVPELLLTRDIVAERAASAQESALEDETVETLLANLEGDGDILDGLEAPAAGAEAGGVSEGHGFVRLARIVENTDEFHSVARFTPTETELRVEESALLTVDAIDDAETTEEGVPVVVTVKDNDVFVEGSVITGTSQPANGSVVINDDGTVTYSPNDGFTGTDTFTYTATTPDGNNADTATVTVVVTGGDPITPPAPPVVSIGDVTVAEGDVAEVVVSLSKASDNPVSVRFQSEDGTATVVGGDYDPASGTITFAPGTTSVTIQFQTNADELQEGTEQFTVNLSDAAGAVIGDGEGIVTILDGFTPVISINDVTVTEGQTAEVTLSLSGPSDQPVSVQFATADDSATVIGGDYDPASGTVTFAPGTTTATVLVQTNEDAVEEPTERLLVNLSNASGATIGDPQGVVTIVDGTEISPPPPPPPPPPPVDTAPTASDGAATTADATLGTDSGTLAFDLGDDTPVTFGAVYDGGLGAATQSSTGGVTTLAANDGSWTLTVNESTGAYAFTQNSAYSHAAGADSDSAVVNITLTDSDGSVATPQLTLTINDDGPTAVADAASATENGPAVEGNVLGNDQAGADGGITVTGLAGGTVGTALAGAHGSLTLAANGEWTYTPNASVPAGSTDVFTYEITDADGDTSSTTLTLTFAGDGSAPTASDGAATTADATLGTDSGTLAFDLGDDTPVTFGAVYDGGLGAATQSSTGGVTTLAANDGSWTLTVNESTGAYAFTQNSAYSHEVGADSDSALVNITLTDSDGSVATPQLTLTINDDGPTAIADAASATENGPAVEGNVLGNDQAGADGGITVTGLSGGTVGTALAGAHGSLTLAANGEWTYTPNASVPAGSTDVFTYEITDADGDTSSTTLTLTFAGDGSAPTASDGAATTADATLGTDSGTLAFDLGDDAPVTFGAVYDGGLGAATQSSSGGVTTLAANDGSWTLTVNESTGAYAFTQNSAYSHEVGADSDSAVVNITLTDSDGSVATPQLTLTINDDGPTAVADAASATENGPAVEGNVLGNDQAGADGGITVTGLSGGTVGTALAGAHGSLTLAANGEWTYTPNVSVPAGSTDVFTYEITDADGDTSSTTLTLTFAGDGSAPTASDGAATTGDAGPASASGTLAFDLGDDTPVTFGAVYDGGLGAATQSSSGGVTTLAADDGSWTLTVNESTGAYAFTQNSAYSHAAGADSDSAVVNITLTDSDGSVATPQLTLTINDDGPTAIADTASATESGPAVEGNVLGNDQAGADGGITVTGLSGGTVGTALAGAHGSLTLAANGEWTYTPNASVPAGSTDVFTYEITDADGDTSSTTLTLTFAGDGSAPTASDGAATTADATLGTDSGTLAFDLGDDTPVTFGAVYDGGLGAATQSSTGGVTTLAANDGSWTLTVNESTGAYAFTQNSAYSHEVGADSDSALVNITLTDSDGSVATPQLTLTINDDGPTAIADAASATENGPAVEGNVLGNDQAGADGGITVTGLSGGTVGTALAGAHGSLTLAANGEWTYTPNASVPAGSSDVFTYEITDADGDTSSTTLTLTFAGDSVPVVTVSNDAMVDEDDLPFGVGDQAPGDDDAVPTGQIQYDLGGDSFASIALSTAGGTTPLFTNDGQAVDTFWDASSSTLIGYISGQNPMVAGSQVFTVALSGINSSSADYAVTLLQPVRHTPSAEEDNVAFSVDVSVTDGDGSVGTTAFTVSIDDDSPYGADTTAATLVVPLSELAVGSLSAGWQNVTSTSGSGSIGSSADSSGIGLQWGGSSGSGYDFDYAPSLVGNVPVQADSVFSVGSLTHNNFPISLSAKVLQTVDLNVSFMLVIDGVATKVTSTVGLSHTETPNNASPSANPANDDFVSISNLNQVQVITVGGREFEVEILGFRDAQGNLVSSVRTVEGQSTSYELFAEVRSMDDLPELQGTVPGNWGADGPGANGSLVWTGESGGQVQGSFGVLAVDGEGGYTYTLSAAARGDMSIGDMRQETFTYTLVDDDGDSQQYTLTLNIDGVANASIVDGVVEGMSYETSSGLTGITDEDGGFNYRPGDTVTLRVGGVVLGSFLAEEAIADGKVFLQEIAGVGLHDLNDDHVEKMAVFLQSIDNDPDPYNGIVITDGVRAALADDAFDLDAIGKDDLQTLLLENGYAPVDEDGAMQHVKDMIVEHAGLTEFDARAADSGALLASPGDDVFAFSLADADTVPPEVSILGFGEAGSDALDLRDLLQGEESADLTSYLNVSYDGSNTVIEVSATGAFTGGADDAGAVSQTIHLEGVDLVSGHDDLASVIQNMLDSGRLTVDQ